MDCVAGSIIVGRRALQAVHERADGRRLLVWFAHRTFAFLVTKDMPSLRTPGRNFDFHATAFSN